MNALTFSPLAAAFARINARRRAVRSFDGRPVPDQVLMDIVQQAQLAPSSHNVQPYRFLCVRSPDLKAAIAPLCNGQQAARTAGALIVVAAAPSLALKTLEAWSAHLDGDSGLPADSVAYHRAELKKCRAFLALAGWPIWSLVLGVLRLLHPALGLAPLGPAGLSQWAARNATYATQALLLAASAHGLDTCPMEGFAAPKLAKALGLRRDVVIPLVIAVGYAAPEGRVEPRWRKPLADAAVFL